MNFVSDNCYGATPEILAAIASIGQSPEPAYGDDDVTQRVTTRFCEIFEREVAVFPVVSGTSVANARSEEHTSELQHSELSRMPSSA